MLKRVSPILLALAAVVAVAGCSGDESDTSSAEPSSSDISETDTATATSVASTEESSPVSTSPSTTVSPSDSGWCLLRREIRQFSESVDESELADPELARQYFDHQLTLVEQAVEVAPPELMADAELNLDVTKDVIAELEANGFSMLTTDLSQFDTPEVNAAKQRVRDYDTDVCGIEADPDDSSDDGSGGFSVGGGSIADQFVAQLVSAGFTEDEARCVFGELDFTDPAGLTNEAVAATFGVCGIDEARLNEINTG